MSDGQLPISYDASIFLRVDASNPMIMRALMTGPADTPYDCGCFIFDIYMTEDYPKVNPMVWFINHGGKRFNPNLYNSGKVCLSLLGTWHSSNKSEIWNETSTLCQILLSIQSQILIEEPYFNEPGYESTIGQPSGIQQSKLYNNNIRLYTLTHTIKDLLENPKLYPQYENIILEHFKQKKDKILTLCDVWTEECCDKKIKVMYENVSADIKKYLSKY